MYVRWAMVIILFAWGCSQKESDGGSGSPTAAEGEKKDEAPAVEAAGSSPSTSPLLSKPMSSPPPWSTLASRERGIAGRCEACRRANQFVTWRVEIPIAAAMAARLCMSGAQS